MIGRGVIVRGDPRGECACGASEGEAPVVERAAKRQGAGGANPTATRLTQYVIAVATLVVIGVATVWLHMRAVRAGYRLGALESERVSLRAQERKLELVKTHESRLEALEARAKRLGLRLPGQDPVIYELLR